MKKLKFDFQHLGNVEVLIVSQMKQVLGGTGGNQGLPGEGGTRCVLYCCPDSGSCAGQPAKGSYDMECSSNEDCQSWGTGAGASCESGYYVAALCKN